jgi:hypothetical protein
LLTPGIYRILEGHKDAFTGAIFRGEFQQIFAFKLDAAAGHLIIFTPGQRGESVLFPEPFGPIMACTSPGRKIQPAQDRFIFNGDLQIFNT